MIKITKIIIFLLIGVNLQTVQAQSQEYEVGQTVLKSGKIEEAQTIFEDILKNDPTFAPAMLGLANVYIRKGDMETTQKYLKQAIETDPENQEFRAEFTNLNELNTLMSQGGRSMKNGELEKAYETFTIAFNKFPYFAEAVYSMGLVKFRTKDYIGSVEHFKQVLALNPKHNTAQAAITNVAKKYFNEGNSAYKRGNLEGALAGYNKVLEIDHGFYQAHYQIGVINSKMGDKEAAIESYELALGDNPEFYKGWFALGLAKNSKNDLEGALEALNQAINIHPGYDKAYVALGDIYVQNNNTDEAIRVLNLAIQVNPAYAKAYANLGVIYSDQENNELALINLETATSLNIKDAVSWFRLAGTYIHLGECDKAVLAARKCTELKSSFGGGWFELGVAEWCNGQGNKTAALNAFEKARTDRNWRKMAEYELDRVKNPQKYES